ncbi:MAG: hypothetical protein R3Y24_05350 [Eubacteriales bacterium]
MKHLRNIFETESYRGTGMKTVSNAVVVTIVLTAVSILAATYVIANFGDLTARIAIGMANFLSSGFLVLIAVIAIIYFIIKLKWKIWRSFLGW